MPYVQAERYLREHLGHFWYLQRGNVERLLRAEDLMFIVNGKDICPLECRSVVGRAETTYGGTRKSNGKSMTVKEKYDLIGHPIPANCWCIEVYGIKEYFPLEWVYIVQVREETLLTA
ncbi:hypothetical protein AAVH_19786 [Aphelenchoides avenae]|nr:hypothetical protein AAVH_19786 [Aphelenchus avenae]